MLKHLTIKNFVLIEEIEIDFETGMNVLYGETGAGKSILVSALTLLKGERASFDKVMDENKKTLIEATFSFDDKFIEQHPYLKDYLEGHELIVSRSLLPSKTSQIRVNGELINLPELKSIMVDVIDITSQGTSSLLRSSQYQKMIIDSFIKASGNKEVFSIYDRSYNEYKLAQNKLAEFIDESSKNDVDTIRYRLERIKRFNIKENEVEELKRELEDIEGMAKNKENYVELARIYRSSGEIFASLRHILRQLSDVDDDARSGLESYESLAFCLSELAQKGSNDEDDEARIDQINSRLFELQDLIKKYGSTHEILLAQRQLEEKLSIADSYESILADLEKKVELKKEECLSYASLLTEERMKAKKVIEDLVNKEMSLLALKEDGFKIAMKKGELSSTGQDEMSMLVSLNKGQEYRPLSEVASGGESSRLIIALISSFNKVAPSDTLILDEVDTGISGQVAIQVAKKIRAISATSLVLAISHLPAVVASADNFYKVYKNDEEERTITHLDKIDKADAINDLAKMISGKSDDKSAIEVAKSLVQEVKC